MRLAIVASVSVLALACSESPSPDKMIASAKEFLAKGDRPAAIIQLKNALQAAPDNGEARFLLGQASFDSRDFPTAENQLRRALELGQPADEVLPLLARAMNELDRQEALIKEFGERKLVDAQAQAMFQTMLGDAYLARNDRAAAAKAYAAALEAKADYAPAQLGEVKLAVVGGQIERALGQVDAILAAFPNFADAHGFRADLLLAKGDVSGARKALEAAIASDASYLSPRLALVSLLLEAREFDDAARLLESTGKIAPRDFRVTYLEASLAFGKEDLAKARQGVQEVFKKTPDHLPTLVLAGAIDLQERHFAAAEANLSKAVARAPNHLGARKLLVQTYLRMGQPAKAKNTLQPLIEKGMPQDPQLLMLAGETFLASGDIRTASDFYQAASKAGRSEAVAAKIRLGQIALAGGRAEEGFRQLEAASELDPGKYQADLAIIAAHLRRKELDKAMTATRALEKKQPTNPLTFQIYGEVYVAKLDAAAARRSFEKALELQPDYLPAARELAKLDISAKRPEDARKRYEAMIAMNSGNDQLYLAQAEFEARAGADGKTIAQILQRAIDANPQSAAARYALITLHLRNNDPKAALVAAQSALAATPGDARIMDAAGTAQQLAGEINQAIETNSKWAALQPPSATPLKRLASLYLGQKNFDMAIDASKRANRLEPNARDSFEQLTRVYMAAGQPAEALSVARELQKKEPKYAGGYALEGDIHAQQKKFAQAEKAYREALKLEPKADRVAIELHRVLVISGKLPEAEAFINRWVAENPKNSTVRLYLADRETSAGNIKVAATHYRAALEREPNSLFALNNLAWIGGELGDPMALGYAERAIKLAPDNPAVLDTYGTLLIRKGEVSKGLEHLQRASTLDSGKYGVRRLKYARALAQAGQKDLARKELEALQAVPEDFPGKSDIPALLKAL